jgi:hypothetical protein
MSLWYESLSLDLSDCGDDALERARCILAYLSMPVPRSWWEDALRTGHIDETHASILHKIQIELSKVADLRDELSTELLVALAFTDTDAPGFQPDSFRDVDAQYTFRDYLDRAKEVLAEHPELAQLGELIDGFKD